VDKTLWSLVVSQLNTAARSHTTQFSMAQGNVSALVALSPVSAASAATPPAATPPAAPSAASSAAATTPAAPSAASSATASPDGAAGVVAAGGDAEAAAADVVCVAAAPAAFNEAADIFQHGLPPFGCHVSLLPAPASEGGEDVSVIHNIRHNILPLWKKAFRNDDTKFALLTAVHNFLAAGNGAPLNPVSIEDVSTAYKLPLICFAL
jgi:hypothetical protein